jgi:hypothetical protein
MGGSWDLKDQVNFWSRKLTALLPEFGQFQSVITDNEHLQKTQSKLFDPVTRLTFYETSPPQTTIVPVTVGYVNSMTAVRALSDTDIFNWTILTTRDYLNPVANIPALGPVLRQTLDWVVEYAVDLGNELSFQLEIVTYVVIAVCVLSIAITQIWQVKWIATNKSRVYTTLLDLPKHNLSAMIDAFRAGRGRNTDETNRSKTRPAEQSKQEDTIMKTFLAGGNGGTSRSIELVLMVVAMSIEVVLFTIAAIVLRTVTLAQIETIIDVAPHLTFIHGMWGTAVGETICTYQMFFINDTEWPSLIWDGKKKELIAAFTDIMTKSTS